MDPQTVAHAEFIFQLAVLLAAASLGGLLVNRLGYPSALGELIVGILLSPYALGVVEYSDTLLIFAELGAILLLFYTGLEADFNQLMKNFNISILMGTLGAILPFILGYLSMVYMGYQDGQALLVGTVLTATSLGITVRMLSDIGRLHTPEGNVVLGAGVIDDVVAVIILSVVLGVFTGSFNIYNATSILVKAIVFWVLTLVIGMKILTLFFDRYFKNVENLTLILIALCFVGSLSAARVGLSSIIGAFAVGLSLSRIRRIGYVRERMDAINLVFVPIFFVSIGMLIDIRIFGDFLIPGVIISIVAVLGKILGCAGAMVFVRWPKNQAFRIGVSMVPRGEMGFAIASLGLASGYMDGGVYGIAVMSVAISTVVAVPLMKILYAERVAPLEGH
ncbi:cation:proton antiporter [Candidatus Bathyarchaeota archaeon]|nr:cation:proton antiporter [Candidatus Bathyarchaeota archaeon]MBS7628893.1 cation:proton antiporter [Candidatus Bathyarchaeota archaeon]